VNCPSEKHKILDLHHCLSFDLRWLLIYDIIVNFIINTGSKFPLSVYKADNDYVEPKPVCWNVLNCWNCFLTCPALCLHFPVLGTLHSATVPFGLFFLGGGGGVVGSVTWPGAPNSVRCCVGGFPLVVGCWGFVNPGGVLLGFITMTVRRDSCWCCLDYIAFMFGWLSFGNMMRVFYWVYYKLGTSILVQLAALIHWKEPLVSTE